MLGAEGSAALLKVEQTDLINYGLIPEFVGRFPVISTLQARPAQSRGPAKSQVVCVRACDFSRILSPAGRRCPQDASHNVKSVLSHLARSLSCVLLPGVAQ